MFITLEKFIKMYLVKIHYNIWNYTSLDSARIAIAGHSLPAIYVTRMFFSCHISGSICFSLFMRATFFYKVCKILIEV